MKIINRKEKIGQTFIINKKNRTNEKILFKNSFNMLIKYNISKNYISLFK